MVKSDKNHDCDGGNEEQHDREEEHQPGGLHVTGTADGVENPSPEADVEDLADPD